MFRLSPIHTNDKLFTSLDWTYLDSRQTNVPKAFQLPVCMQNNLSFGYNISSRGALPANINYNFNQNDAMGWSVPSNFPIVLNRIDFTKIMLHTNQNTFQGKN